MNFAEVKSVTIPEGNVVKITSGGTVLWQASALPGAYQQVEWVQAAANVGAYIDLGFSYDTGAKICLGQWIMNTNTAYPFGATDSTGGYRCCLSSPFYGNSNLYYRRGDGTATSINIKCVLNEFNHLVGTYKNGNIQLENLTSGVSASSADLASYTINANHYLFAQNYKGAPRWGDIRRISYFQYYDKTDTLICDLIPCYRKSDGVIGMYDLARKMFLTNVGSGSFTKGADV